MTALTLSGLIVKSVEKMEREIHHKSNHVCSEGACVEWIQGLQIPVESDSMILHCAKNARTVHICGPWCKYIVLNLAEDIATCTYTSMVVATSISKLQTKVPRFVSDQSYGSSRFRTKTVVPGMIFSVTRYHIHIHTYVYVHLTFKCPQRNC